MQLILSEWDSVLSGLYCAFRPGDRIQIEPLLCVYVNDHLASDHLHPLVNNLVSKI